MKKIKLFLMGLLAISMLCVPISATDCLDVKVSETERCNLYQELEISTGEALNTAQDKSEVSIYIDDEYRNADETNIQLPHSFSGNFTNSIQAFDTIARLQIFSWVADDSRSSSIIHSHAFIVITNFSKQYIAAGGFNIAPGTGISIGTWDKIGEHKGLWYGLEGYMYEYQNDYRNSYSMSVMLNSSLLEKANKIIKNGDTWEPFNNCSSFATRVWNEVCADKLDAGVISTPLGLRNSIMSYGEKRYEIDALIPRNYSPYYGTPPKKSEYFSE